MMTRANVTWALLFVSFQLFSQQSSRTIDALFQSALKVGRSDAKKVARVIDSLQVLNSDERDSIPVLCLRALMNYTGDKQVGLKQIAKARQLANALGVEKYDHQILYVKGLLLKQVSNDSAFYCLLTARKMSHAIRDSIIERESYTVLSFLEMERGNFVKAWQYLEQARRLFSNDDYQEIVRNHINQSHALFAIGLDDRSIKVSQEGISIAHQHRYEGSREHLLSLHGNLIESYLNAGQSYKALECALEGSLLFPNIDSLRASNPDYLISLGDAYLSADSAAAALRTYRMYSPREGYYGANFRVLFGIFRCYRKLEDVNNSNITAKLLVKSIPQLKGLKAQMEIYKIAEEAYNFLGIKDSAYKYHQQYFDSYRQLYNQKQSSSILENEFTAELNHQQEKSQLQASMLESEIKLGNQRVFFLIIILILIISLVGLLIIRYRSLKKFSLLLEEKVQERTRELTLRNNQLSEYAFINAHKLRAPLARILGLTELMAREEHSQEIIRLNRLLKNESESLDLIIRSISEAIREDRIFNRNDVS
ncbi:MAG: hypothetical protein JNJ75_17590 [Cyclobacteriaceae bacterium]|nr:hypothetical protein [Cyclobacteriaceae bacterium]